MKLFSATTFLVSAVFATLNADVAQATPASYFTLGAAGGGCIGLKKGTAEKGDRLVLSTCEADDDSIQWTKDKKGRLHSKVDRKMCVQAGKRNSVAEAGTELRMIECDDSELQQFDFSDFVSEAGLIGHIMPASAPEMCLVHNGPTADIGDAIILKKCAILSGDRALGWKAAFPRDEGEFYFTLTAPRGGCMGLKNTSAHRGSYVFLRHCELGDDTILWTLDENNKFHSKADETMCIQAGRSDKVAKSGTKLRVVPCGFSDLQMFDLSEALGEGGISGPIKPADSPELCVVHKNGPSAVIGEEPIVLKECAIIHGIRKHGWDGDFPEAMEY